MPRTTTLNREEQGSSVVVETEPNGSDGNGLSNGAERRRGSPFMSSLLPEMISDPYPIDACEGMDSYDFAMEKCRRFIVGPLKFKSEKEWLAFAKDTWGWVEGTADREARTQADQLVQRIQDLIAETQKDPKLNQLIKEKLAAVVEAD